MRWQRGARVMIDGVIAGLLLCTATDAHADLATYGYDNARLGASPASAGIAPAKVRQLHVVWRAKLGGAINDQALVLDGVRVKRRRRDVAYVGTEHGSIIAIDTTTGTPLWRRSVGSRTIRPDCEAVPDGRFGITGTMVADRATDRLYAVDVNGLAWALDLKTGAVVPGWPVRVHRPADDFVWGGLALSRGRLYVAIASLCDSGQYYGGVTAVDVTSPGHFVTWRTTAGTHAYAGGIWGWGGVSIDRGSGEVFGATGNSLGTANEAEGDSESVVRLSPSLRRLEADRPLAQPFAMSDRDFGTTPVLIDAPRCSPLLVAINKIGAMYVYNRSKLSAGPTQSLAVAADSSAGIPLYGIPAYDPVSRTLVLMSPSAPPNSSLRAGVQAFTLTRSCQFMLKWQRSFDPPDAGGPPTIAEGVVYVGSGRNGWLRAFRLSDGARLFGAHLTRGTIFAAPTVDHGSLYIGTWSGELVALRPKH